MNIGDNAFLYLIKLQIIVMFYFTCIATRSLPKEFQFSRQMVKRVRSSSRSEPF